MKSVSPWYSAPLFLQPSHCVHRSFRTDKTCQFVSVSYTNNSLEYSITQMLHTSNSLLISKSVAQGCDIFHITNYRKPLHSHVPPCKTYWGTTYSNLERELVCYLGSACVNGDIPSPGNCSHWMYFLEEPWLKSDNVENKMCSVRGKNPRIVVEQLQMSLFFALW